MNFFWVAVKCDPSEISFWNIVKINVEVLNERLETSFKMEKFDVKFEWNVGFYE